MAKNRPRFLLLRWGGMGDNMFLTTVARILNTKGYDVDIATHEKGKALFEHNSDIKNIILEERFGAIQKLADGKPVNLVNLDGLILPDVALYKNYINEDCTWKPYNVANYFRSIESNTIHPELSQTQSSNYINTYDLHLSWAGIDPTSVDDSLKRPVYHVTTKEREWAKSILKGLSTKPIAIQTQASSPARSISSLGIITWLREKNEHLIVWENNANGGHWLLNGVPITFPEDIAPIRLSAALIEQCKFAITSDTCVAHLSEALKVPHLTFYSTVPAWTRSKYYRYEITIDATVEFQGGDCKCCIISANCPRKEKEALAKLTAQELELLGMIPANHNSRQNMPIPAYTIPEKAKGDPISYFEVTNEGALNQKIDSALRRFYTLMGERAYCVASIDLVKELETNYDKLCKGDF